MGKKSKQVVERRQRVEQMRREQQAAERRRTFLIIGGFALVGLLIIGAAAYVPLMNWINDPARKPMTAFGVPATQAGVTEPTKDSADGTNDHKPDGTQIDYNSQPPSSGAHWARPAPFQRTFYTAEDRPEIETLVHNLEHGYLVVWYDETIAEDDEQMEQLEQIAQRFQTSKFDPTKKFIVAPWTSDDGEAMPQGKHITVSRWTVDAGRRIFMSKVSGEAIEDFMKKYSWKQAPEPNGA